MTPDQTSFERTHVPGTLVLHGLEKASSAFRLDNGLELVWSGVTSVWDGLIRGSFERTLV